MKRFAAILTALMLLCSFAQAEMTNLSTLQTQPETHAAQPAAQMPAQDTLITTVGTAEAVAPIDIAVLSFSVKAEGETVAEANKLVTNSISTITGILTAQGVAEDQIWHKRYDVSPNIVYHNTKLTDDEVIDGYIVEITLNVRLTDISLVGVVIDAAMQSGAGYTHELQFERSTAQEVYQKALAQAVQQAMQKAEHLAQGCGMELGLLVSVTELSTPEDGEARVQVSYCAQ